MTDRLIETVARLPRCMPEVNLPVQAGSDKLLKIMRRGYTTARYRALIANIRAAIPHISLTTDLIVGHPGETDEDFAQTMALCEEIGFDKIHIAAFSARPGTPAAEQEQDPALAVPEPEKQARRIALEQIYERVATQRNAAHLGETVEVLVEGESRGKWRGRSPGNKLVFFAHPADWVGRVARVHIIQTSPWALQGALSQP
jgi:tRNA-2-methylthio-N6-dimethylallyladenosine synthase